MSLAPGAMRRLMREVATLRTSPPDGLRIVTSDEDMLDIIGVIAGPEGTPYEGGYFRVKFQFTDEFPAAPPKCTMLSKIFHPNVSKSGEICVNTLKKDWKREYGIAHILVTIKCLLIYPNAESALDEAAGKLLLEDYSEYFKHAKLITGIHATPRTRPVEFETPSAHAIPTATATVKLSSPRPPEQAPSVSLSASSSSRAPSAAPSESVTMPSKPISKSSSSNGLLAVVEATEPLQLSPSNNSGSLQLKPSLHRSSSASQMSEGGGPMKENGPSSGPVVSPLNNGPLQPASGTNGTGAKPTTGAVKRPGAVGGVAKRKKGLKRL